MESNWRYKVWYYGLSLADYTMCSELLFDTNLILLKWLVSATHCRFTVLRTNAGWPYEHHFTTGLLPVNTPFPWIYEVAPD